MCIHISQVQLSYTVINVQGGGTVSEHQKTQKITDATFFIITLYISTTSKNYNSYLPDLAETAKYLIAKN